MAEQKARVAEARQRGSSEGCDAAGEGEEAAAVCEASREDGEDAESKGQAANAHVRIMCVSCVSCVYLCNDVCTYHMCPRLVDSFDYCARAYMLTHTVFTNTTCEEKKPQVHRRNQGPVAVRIQLQASQPLARRPLLVSVATGNQAREYTPGPRAGNATSNCACKFTGQLRASAAGGWVYIYAPWPAGPPHAHRKFACLWSVCVHYQMNSTVAIWACSLRLAP